MVKIPKEAVELMASKEADKVLATADEKGIPNAAAIWSLRPVGDDQIAFADIFMKKTKDNLLKNKKACVLVVNAPNQSFQLKGDFLGFQTSGPAYDSFAKAMAATKATVKGVGLIKVTEVYSFPPKA